MFLTELSRNKSSVCINMFSHPTTIFLNFRNGGMMNSAYAFEQHSRCGYGGKIDSTILILSFPVANIRLVNDTDLYTCMYNNKYIPVTHYVSTLASA